MAQIEELYASLNALLEDICKFLSVDKLKGLSTSDRTLADSLIMRSKLKLQEISKVTIANKNPDEEYVVMDRSSDESSNANTESNSRKSSIKIESLIGENNASPFKDLPAKEASKQIKSGYISMRRRVWKTSFERMRRVYATIHNDWMLIYWNEKDLKPICDLNLKEHFAKQSDMHSQKSEIFELTTTTISTKTYYFEAQTHKDMLQWVSHINDCNNKPALPSIIVENKLNNYELEGTYDDINPNNNDSDEDIYYEISGQDSAKNMVNVGNNVDKTKDCIQDIEEKPPLPGRRPLTMGTDISKRSLIQVSKQNSSSSESSDSIYDAIGVISDNQNRQVENDKNSDDDETYSFVVRSEIISKSLILDKEKLNNMHLNSFSPKKCETKPNVKPPISLKPKVKLLKLKM